MSPLTCQQIEAQIELYAAGACDPRTDGAIREHLALCPACALADREARQLIGLLDVRFQEPERLERLHARLQAESQRRTRRWSPMWRPVAALAAMLLLTVGLAWSVRPGEVADVHGGGELAIALVPAMEQIGVKEASARGNPFGPKPAILPGPAPRNPFTYPLNLHGQTAKDFRAQLQAAAGTDRLPPPPEIDLSLELRNTTHEELRIAPLARRAELQLDLAGPGAVTVAGPASDDEPFRPATIVAVAPGQSFKLPIRRLVYGSRQAIRRAYWTEPGDYTLTVRYRVAVCPAPRGARPAEVPGSTAGRFGYVMLQGPPIKLQIVAAAEPTGR
jgi:hypothetical protein